MKFKLVSLFSGAGGADLGFHQAGFQTVFANDIDPVAVETFEKNFDIPVWPAAIQYTPSTVIPDCDVIIGGPPCQSFSNARTSAKETFRTCSGLTNLNHMKRIVDAKKPKFFVCENVATLLDLTMLPAYTEFKYWPGYNTVVYRLNAENFGIPQKRVRLFFIGVREDINAYVHCPSGTHWKHLYSGWAEFLGLPPVGHLLKRSNGKERVGPTEAFYTLTGADNPVWRYDGDNKGLPLMTQVRIALGVKQRYLTHREKAKLQGFPDDFEFCGGSQDINRQIGNAWCVPVGRAIAMELRKHLVSVS
jgi:DNA (cytosine-5)-methyltransferase 1